MDFDDQIELEHILFTQRKCRVCGKVKNLLDDFYKTHKDRGPYPSAYSYECKQCTVKRIMSSRKSDKKTYWTYPDW